VANLTLYGPGFSTYVRTARMTLAEKQVPYDLEEVNFLQGMPKEHLARHPFGKVPSIDDNGFELYETFAICRYVDEKFDGPALQPESVAERAKMTQVINILDNYTYNAFITRTVIQRIVVPMLGGNSDESIIEGAKADADKSLEVLDAIIGDKEFVVGNQLTLADLHFVPIYTYFQLTPEAKPLLETRHNIERWYKGIKDRACVRDLCPPELK
jgi:glutathione S-transferase